MDQLDNLPESVREASTGIEFPTKLEDVGGEPLTLGSTGVRKRFLFSVYAFGIYFEEHAARAELERWNTYDMDELRTNLSFYNAVAGSNFDKAVRMVLHRTIKGNDLRVAFEESLRPRVKRYAEIYSTGHSKKNQRKIQNSGLVSLKEFRNQFSAQKLVQGTEIVIRNHGHTLTTFIDRKPCKSLECHSLCSALFDVFLGASPISTASKELFAMRLSLLIVPMNRLTEYKIRRALKSRL